MADNTKIEWADATANYVNGCTRVSPGCGGPGPHGGCYAERLAGTRLRNHPSRAGTTRPSPDGPRWTGDIVCNPDVLTTVLRWKRPRRIFWNAHGDLFHPNVPDELIDRQWAVMALTPQHTHMVLTKRPERMREYLTDAGLAPRLSAIINDWPSEEIRNGNEFTADMRLFDWWSKNDPLPNVWLGTSVENQQYADERTPHLLATPAAVRLLSCEPLLGALNLRRIRHSPHHHVMIDALDGYALSSGGRTQIDWVIIGGESGPNARPMHPDWARSLRDQCAAAGVPFFFKQWGAWAQHPIGEPVTIRQYHDQIGYIDVDTGDRKRNPNRTTDETMRRVGKKRAGHLLDGVEHHAFPERRAS